MNIMMNITRGHLVGFAAGIGASALAYYLYKANEEKVDAFLRQSGIEVPSKSAKQNWQSLSLEELVAEKETLEDLIAEREMGS